MRILQVTDTYLPHLGGIETLVDDLSRHQRLHGDQVQVLTIAPPERRDDDTLRVASGVVSPLRGLIRRYQPDVVHCHSSVVSPLAWRAARQAAQLDLPVVITMHSLVPLRGPVALSLKAVTACIPPDVRWSAVSSVAASALSPLVRGEVDVLPNGFDLSEGIPANPGTGEVPRIISVMRLASRKRPLQLIDILARVKLRLGHRPWRAMIVGDGPQHAAVQRAVRRAGLGEHVHLLGRLTRARTLRLLATADLYVAPALLESFGIAALEARCAGLPVVAMRSGGVGEFVEDGVHGYLTASDDEMVVRICQLLNDSALTQRLGQFSLADPPDFGWPGTIERHLEAYQLAGATLPADRGTVSTSPSGSVSQVATRGE